MIKELQTNLYGLAVHTHHFATVRRLDRQGGATAIEYALIAAVMAVVVVAAFTLLGDELETLFGGILEVEVPE